jgi:hypothetical protein
VEKFKNTSGEGEKHFLIEQDPTIENAINDTEIFSMKITMPDTWPNHDDVPGDETPDAFARLVLGSA